MTRSAQLLLTNYSSLGVGSIAYVPEISRDRLIGIGIFFSRLLFLLTRNTLVHYSNQ